MIDKAFPEQTKNIHSESRSEMVSSRSKSFAVWLLSVSCAELSVDEDGFSSIWSTLTMTTPPHPPQHSSRSSPLLIHPRFAHSTALTSLGLSNQVEGLNVSSRSWNWSLDQG